MTHDRGINAKTSHEQEVMPGFGSSFHLACIFRWSSPISRSRGDITIRSSGKGQAFYFYMPDINLASLAIDQCERGFHRLGRYADFAGPDVSGTARNDAHTTAMTLGIHDTIHHLVQGAITTVSDHQVMFLPGSLSGQF